MRINDFLITYDNSLLEVLEAIDRSGMGLAILVDAEGKFIRTVTDGDVRRLMINYPEKENNLQKLQEIKSIYATENENNLSLITKMKENDIQHLPILNSELRPVDVVLRKNIESPIFLSSPHIGDNEIQFVNEAFDTNWIAPLGPNVEMFEKEFAEKVGCKYALSLSSGTAALHLAMIALNVGRDDIVFCSSLTFVASANPILYQGATPVFIDSEPETWNMSPPALARALEKYEKLGKKPKAVVIVNLYGQSANMNELMAICDTYGVPVIEDAAESLGATYKGQSSGTFGCLGIYSFNGNKIITTSGGGMLVSDDKKLIDHARFLSTQAKDPANYYLHTQIGYNYRMSNILAGVGRGQLMVLDERVKTRRKIFQMYQEAFNGSDLFEWMPEPEGYYSTRWLTCALLKTKNISPDQILNLSTRRGIEIRRIWKPLHTQPLFQGVNYFSHDETLSFSDHVFERGICLPSGLNMTITDIKRVIELFSGILH